MIELLHYYRHIIIHVITLLFHRKIARKFSMYTFQLTQHLALDDSLRGLQRTLRTLPKLSGAKEENRRNKKERKKVYRFQVFQNAIQNFLLIFIKDSRTFQTSFKLLHSILYYLERCLDKFAPQPATLSASGSTHAIGAPLHQKAVRSPFLVLPVLRLYPSTLLSSYILYHPILSYSRIPYEILFV